MDHAGGMKAVLEICVDSPAGVAAAIAGGADRIELCGALELGGITPSPGLVAAALAQAARPGVGIHAMVRPRAGNFAYDDDELDWAVRDARWLLDQGVDGLVFGAVRDGAVDKSVVARWRDAIGPAMSRPVELTFHRAIDAVADPLASVDAVVALGFDRILTSGGAVSVLDGAATVRAMVERAADRCVIMAGAGVRPGNVREIMARAGVRQIHASAASAGNGAPDPRLRTLGFETQALRYTDVQVVRELKMILDNMTNIGH